MSVPSSSSKPGTPGPPALPHLQKTQAPPALPPARDEALQSQYLNQEDLERFESLLMFARTTVEGYFAGRHKSPHFGFSAEFVEHKAYVQGDETSHLDWRVYARTKKLYTRKYLEETDMTIHFLVDASTSMQYKGAGKERKYARVARIAAALSYLAMKQGDKAALGLFTDKLVDLTPPGGTRRHLFRMLQTLEKIRVFAIARTDLPRALEEAGSRLRKRGRLVVLSDFLGMDIDAVFDALSMYAHRGFEIMLMQVLDPDELELPDVNLARFRDMETGLEVQVEPEEIRSAYEQALQSLTEDLRVRTSRRRMEFALLNTKAPYLEAIEAYLGYRRK